MNAKTSKKAVVILSQAVKIAVGSSAAIYIATLLNLQFAASAGIITLLTILTTKLETLRLSLFRIVTFIFSVALSWIVFQHLGSAWLAYGLFILIIVAVCEMMGWKATISVNAVIGTHFLTNLDFGIQFIINEFLLVLIGITLAIILNLFIRTESLKTRLKHNIQYTEEKLQMVMDELASYLVCERMEQNVWDDAISLEKHLEHFIDQAYEYQGNALKKHADYYIMYFEMRYRQCGVLHNLHYEMKKIRNMPAQALVIADYIRYMRDYITEMNDPTVQIAKLEQVFRDMEQEELPKTRGEFESRAILYHILMDLEEFLVYKRRFIESVDEVRINEYWEL